FGWRRVHLAPSDAHPDEVDDGREIAAGDVHVRVADDGTFTARLGDVEYAGLAGLEDQGDRGDSYDFDPVGEPVSPPVESMRVTRTRHESGIQRLAVERSVRLPAGLDETRKERSDETVAVRVVTEARVAPGVERVDLHVETTNPARDHRLRLRFPTGAPVA